MKVDRSTPFWDTSLTNEQRIGWLLSRMTIEEKLASLSSRGADIERLGIPGFSVGGEAAHGVEGRNDQNGLGEPDVTTSFPQPIGMSASWDPQLMYQAGEVTGREARVVYHRHPRGGLSRWAPTVDLERDPRWGRNEEGYGEDPLLTGAMAGAYIRGMQGEDPYYVRCAATLKHFYGNNTEAGRGWKNSSIDPRNQKELYLEPFRRCIEEAGALGVMTAYNKINGTVGVLNPEVKEILKKQYGLKHAVSDGGAMELVVTLQHYYGQHAETIAGAIKAGVDAMSDDPAAVERAAAEAYELGLLTEEQIDEALRNVFDLKLRLGVYDRENRNPYDRVTEEDIDSGENRRVCLELTREAIVLLKNDNCLLPLPGDIAVRDLALIGPLGDVWYQDWYGGTAPYRKTLRQGLEEVLQGAGEKNAVCGREDDYSIDFADGLDRVTLRYGSRYLAVAEDNTLGFSDEPEVFIKENWGEGSFTFKCVRTGKYLCVRMPKGPGDPVELGRIAADRDEPFDWFVTEIFHIEEQEDGSIILTDRFHHTVKAGEDGALVSIRPAQTSGADCGKAASQAGREPEGIRLRMERVEDGVAGAAQLAAGKKVILLALGCNPMINAKEEIDRRTLCLPPDQERLLKAVRAVNPNIVLVLFANYPYTIPEAQESIPAILTSATGSQDMGTAMAETIFGLSAPAGRLNMTWYQDVRQLPDIDDYDIIKGKRTYRYFDGEVLYPFGYGLTYTDFAYTDIEAHVKDGRLLQVAFTVTNTGKTVSDEVAQVYAKAPASRVEKPLCQLIGFTRLKAVKPGETRRVRLDIVLEELRFYDVISKGFLVEEGVYQIYAGASSQDRAVSTELFIPGGKTGIRDMTKRIAADHYDDYDNIVLTEGHFGFKAATLRDTSQPGRLVYRDCGFGPEEKLLSLHLKSEKGGRAEIYLDSVLAGSWEGDTVTCEHRSAPKLDRLAWMEITQRNQYRHPNYEDFDIRLTLPQAEEAVSRRTLELRLYGDVKLCFLRALREAGENMVRPGQAN